MADKKKQMLIAAIALVAIVGAGAFMVFSAKKADTSYYNPKPTFKKPSEFPPEAFK